jgi:hypothetical protein
LFSLLHANGMLVSQLFTALSVAVGIVLGAEVLQAETKMVPTMMTLMMTNKTYHGAPSTPPSNPCPREGEGKGKVDEIEGGGPCRGRWW